jgi:PAS domain S-box-containing protein
MIKPHTNVYIVNDDRKGAIDAIKALEKLAIVPLNYIPFYPGAEVLEGVHTAVAIGEMQYIPDTVKLRIDLGTRIPSISAIIDICNVYNIPPQVINEVSSSYMSNLIKLLKINQSHLVNIHDAEQVLRSIFHNSKDGMCLIDYQGRVQTISDTFKNMLQFRDQKIIGNDIRSLFENIGISQSLDKFLYEPIVVKNPEGREVLLNATEMNLSNNRAVLLYSSFTSDINAMEVVIRKNSDYKLAKEKYNFDNYLTQDPYTLEMLERTKRLALNESTILIQGESGTGKEIIAQSIHNESARRNQPFVPVNFAGMQSNLLESELFGYVDGAFTGALKGGSKGLFEMTHKGTIFFDEIGDAPMSFQVRLLRVLQEKEIRRIGDSKRIPIDVILSLFKNCSISDAAEYLCLELMAGGQFVISLEAKAVYDDFMIYLRDQKAKEIFIDSRDQSKEDLEGQFYLIKEWLIAYSEEDLSEVIYEVIVMLLKDQIDSNLTVHVSTKTSVEDLIGSHNMINEGRLDINYTEFMKTIAAFKYGTSKLYMEFQEIKKDLIRDFKNKLRLEDFKPNVLTSFVRNKLIDDVYLPLIGDNLAKQMGVVGENKRTDLMGLLLLVSPPGYGKTTLMEYIASRLGFILVKVNGPSLGHEVTSLDPEKASHSSAKEELRKLNLALKMGNNIMLYIDDIQHCHPEFLQKFISLCDGQRKIEGVYNGIGQTFDLRGKKIAVVMAGNPYTESGEKFKIPDMLANRADVYNLGDMSRENEEAFVLSYIENSLTSNPVLSKLSNRSQSDLYGLIKLAEGADPETVNLESSYTADELNEYTEVIKKLNVVRDVVLRVNKEYIYSAAQSDAYRNEPAFKLQGSYRNMNKIAERVVSVMNDEELFAQIQTSYENDCQTLTSGAESNILKWKEIVDCMTEDDVKRYEAIKKIYNKNKLAKGDDKMGQAVVALTDLTDQMSMIKDILNKQ